MKRLFLPLLAVMLGSGCGWSQDMKTGKPLALARSFNTLPVVDPLTGNIGPVHDPAIARKPDGTYIVFSTDAVFMHDRQLLEMRCSADLKEWHGCGYVFDQMPDWIQTAFPQVRGLWAPDISFFHGMYHLYYAASTLGSQTSAIGVATNITLDAADPRYKWVDQGPVLTSSDQNTFNAIDPNVLVEPATDGKEPRVWLSYGSFWAGIFQQEIDPETGKLLPNAKQYHLAQQPDDRKGALEGASMLAHDGWFYLFASIGLCCEENIENDTYEEIVGRSHSVHGPFVAEDGRKLIKGGGGILLMGYENWLGTGGGTAWQSDDGKTALFTFHALNRSKGGAFELWVENMTWEDDWPVLRPLP